jgi:predicted ATPase
MIASIKLNNFFSFNGCKIDFCPGENILVGINGVGKSNLLKAIKLLKEGVSGIGFRDLIISNWGGFDAIFNYSNDNDSTISIEYEFDFNVIKKYGFSFTENVFYNISIKKVPYTSNFYIEEQIFQPKDNVRTPWIYLQISNGSGVALTNQSDQYKKTALVRYSNLDPQSSALFKDITDPDRYFALSTIRKAIADIVIYDYFDTTPSSKIRKPVLPTTENKLLSDGSNLPQVLNTLNINDKNNFRVIKKLLKEINNAYSDFDFNHIGGNIELMLEEQNLNKSIHVTNISDGTLRFLCLLSILYNEKRGSLICIDEPEVGLHPDMVLTISNSIKHAAKSSQVFVATHSENLLNNFKLEDVKVFEKNEKNSTCVNSFSEKDFKDWYESFSVGKMWRQGDIGGNRY